MIELAVIGAGPCGLAVGIAAQESGLQCVLFDRGCVVSSIAGYPTHMTFFSTAERLEIGGVPFVVVGDKPTRREALRYYQRLARQFRLGVHQFEEVRAVDRQQDGFRLHTRTHTGAEHSYDARNIVVATGYFDAPNLLGVPGEDLPHVAHSYREGHSYYDQDVVIVGGGNSAVDAALELCHWGARVTMVHFADGIDPNVKPWVRPHIEARLRDQAVRARFRSRVVEIRPDVVRVRDDGTASVEDLQAQWVLAMTGYTPHGELLRSLGVVFDDATGIPEHDANTMQTNVAGVFIAGVLSAGRDANKVFIENGRGHGELIVRHLAGG